MHLQGLAKLSRRKEEKEHRRLSFAGRLLQQVTIGLESLKLLIFL
jgi:hypothetical protein